MEKSAAAEIACLVLSRGVSQGGGGVEKTRRGGMKIANWYSMRLARVRQGIKDARTRALRIGHVLQRRELESD